MKRRNSGKKGGTLVELLVVLAIGVSLSALILSAIQNARHKAKVAIAKCAITQYATMLEVIKGDVDRYPPQVFEPVWSHFDDFPTLKALTEAAPPFGCNNHWGGPYLKLEQRIDPWGTPYYYGLEYKPVKGFGPFVAHHTETPTFDYSPAGPGVLIMRNLSSVNVHSNRILLNGVEIIPPSEMVNALDSVTKNVVLLAENNVLDLRLLSNPGTTVEIILSDSNHINGYTLKSYGEDRKPGGENYAGDLTWTAGQSAPGFN